LGILAPALLIGCARKVPATGPIPQPNPQPKVATDVKDRVAQMRDLTNQVTRVVSTRPAPDDNAQRQTMHDAFDLFSRALPLLMGPEADGQFRLQQRIIADARDRLARDGPTLAAEPTIDAGLRAVFNALVRISQESFYTSTTITAGISDLHDRVDALDTVRGPMHRLAVAKAAQQSAAVMDDMTRIYAARLDRRRPEPAVPNPKRESEQPPPSNSK
jgi:hypothetical protein